METTRRVLQPEPNRDLGSCHGLLRRILGLWGPWSRVSRLSYLTDTIWHKRRFNDSRYAARAIFETWHVYYAVVSLHCKLPSDIVRLCSENLIDGGINAEIDLSLFYARASSGIFPIASPVCSSVSNSNVFRDETCSLRAVISAEDRLKPPGAHDTCALAYSPVAS